MRKVDITIQNIVQPKAVFFGLTIKQITAMVIGIVIAVITFSVMFILNHIQIDFTMAVVFFELVLTAGYAVVRINGVSLFKWLIIMLKGPIYRPYQSKGVLSSYEEEEETK